MEWTTLEIYISFYGEGSLWDKISQSMLVTGIWINGYYIHFQYFTFGKGMNPLIATLHL